MGFVDNGLDKIKEQNQNKEGKETDYIDKRLEAEKKVKKLALKRSHPYTYIKYLSILFFLIPIALIISLSILLTSVESPIATLIFKVFSLYIYLLTLYLQFFQEILNYISMIFGLKFLEIPIEIIFYYPFLSDIDLSNHSLFDINYFTFSNNLYNIAGEIYTSLDSKEIYKSKTGIFIIIYFQTYLLTLFLVKILFRNFGEIINISELADKYKKLIKNPENHEKANLIKKEILKNAKASSKINITRAYMTFFTLIDPVVTNMLESKIYKITIKKKSFQEQIREIFEENLSNKYENMANFLEESDRILFDFELTGKKYEQTIKPYTNKNINNYKSKFNGFNKYLLLPILISRLRFYRTFDLHNLFQEGMNNKELFFLDNLDDEKLNKLKRLSKEGYKLFLDKNPNQDSIKFSIELRYPYTFSFNDIFALEEIREKIKIKQTELCLKYLSSDKEMHIYSISDGVLNNNVLKLLNDDIKEYINIILSFNELFFKVLKKDDKYNYLENNEGSTLKNIMIKLININFNINTFLKELKSLNSTHFKGLYFIETTIDDKNEKNIIKILENINNTEIDYTIFSSEHSPHKDLQFLELQNIGYFKMLEISQDLLGIVQENSTIKSLLDEFKFEYNKIK